MSKPVVFGVVSTSDRCEDVPECDMETCSFRSTHEAAMHDVCLHVENSALLYAVRCPVKLRSNQERRPGSPGLEIWAALSEGKVAGLR